MKTPTSLKVAIYARVSTLDQNCAMQLEELHRYATASGWEYVEYVDDGVSGAKASRPALDRLMKDAREKRVGAVICWKLDRFGRSMKNLIENIEELDQLGIRFICPTQGIDTNHSSPTGRLLVRLLAILAEFERDLIRERVNAGIAQHKRNVELGRLGRDLHTRSGKDLPNGRPKKVMDRRKAWDLRTQGKSFREISKALGVPMSTVRRAILESGSKGVFQTPGSQVQEKKPA